MLNDKKSNYFPQVVRLLGLVPFVVFLYWFALSSSNLLVLFLWTVSIVVVAAHYFYGYSAARWTVGLFAFFYCGFQSYVFFSLLGSSSTAVFYFIFFAVLFVNALVLLFSRTIASSFSLKKQTLSSATLKRLRLLLWLLVVTLSSLLVNDVVRLFV